MVAERSDNTLFGKTLKELREVCSSLDMPQYASEQLASWLYKQAARGFDSMSNISRAHRTTLSETFTVGTEPPLEVKVSSDSTRKYLFRTGDSKYVEAAYMPDPVSDRDRGTLCISTQNGCSRACGFCVTGLQGLQGNLSVRHIINQYHSLPEKAQVTNIVYMGMGEPLDNTDAVLKSLEILTSEYGYAMSPRKVTVSTVGILPEFEELLYRTQCNIALSLHTPFWDERRRLMPVEKRHPAADILDIMRGVKLEGRRRFSIEYCLFDGINDSTAHARELVRVLHGIRCRINLIPFNPSPNMEFRPSTQAKTAAFQALLKEKGMTATLRKSRGQDIQAACGLLSTSKVTL